MALLEVRDPSRHFGGRATFDGPSFGVEEDATRCTARVGALDGPAIDLHDEHVGKAYLGG